ncbi:MAG: AAA family ATPase, partial [Spirulinaceae cyanobacterium]
ITQLNKPGEQNDNLDSTLQKDLKKCSEAISKTQTTGEDDISAKQDHLENVASSIDQLLQYEQDIDSNQKAIEILKENIPIFLLFSDEERYLESSFNLAQLSSLKPKKALRNLLEIAELDIDKISKAFKSPDIIKSIIDKGNNKVQEIYKGKWSQSKINPILDVNGQVLIIMIENKEKDFFDIAKRSDGLRQFVALINFLEVKRAKQPVLLIDEAELHLHYDAQADIVEMFTKQQFAAKIIYTTHSVGCLPEDLGTGVKLVSPSEDTEERSTIKKPFWSTDKRSGVLPLLFGMGANQLAFMAIRQSVFVEGATDMLLLPTLLRQATQKDHLGFQVVPGIAMTAKADFGLLENHGSKVAFLVDNDKEGDKYKKQLQESGIEEKRIFKLPNGGEATVLEDYIRKDLYLEAVKEQIKNWNEEYSENSLTSLEDIPDQDRPKAVEKWCKEKGLKCPEKMSITYYLLDLATGEKQEKLIENSYQNSFAELYKNIIAVFSSSIKEQT